MGSGVGVEVTLGSGVVGGDGVAVVVDSGVAVGLGVVTVARCVSRSGVVFPAHAASSVRITTTQAAHRGPGRYPQRPSVGDPGSRGLVPATVCSCMDSPWYFRQLRRSGMLPNS
jgi:hypothetical protein